MTPLQKQSMPPILKFLEYNPFPLLKSSLVIKAFSNYNKKKILCSLGSSKLTKSSGQAHSIFQPRTTVEGFFCKTPACLLAGETCLRLPNLEMWLPRQEASASDTQPMVGKSLQDREATHPTQILRAGNAVNSRLHKASSAHPQQCGCSLFLHKQQSALHPFGLHHQNSNHRKSLS